MKTQSKQALEIIKSSKNAAQKIDWKKLIEPIKEITSKQKDNNPPAGRKRFDLLVIVKCFILQSIYNLSDPRLEEEIADRRSFFEECFAQIFLDLNSLDSIPYETTIYRYREIFARLGLDKKLFYEFNKRLKELNLIVGKGSIVDTTIKQAQATPQSKRDKDADFTQK
ncbi:MAG: transposase, partial [Candidatus Woesearchaeota archaeon]